MVRAEDWIPVSNPPKHGQVCFISDGKDWEAHGASTIIVMREKDPVQYVKVVAAMLPEQVEHEVGAGLAALLSGITDTEGTGEVIPVEETGTGAVCH
jgi:hypothetical protein